MPDWKRYTVTADLLRYWRGRYGCVPSCGLCGRQLVEGDEALGKSVQRSASPWRRYYHVACFDEGSVPRVRPREEAGP